MNTTDDFLAQRDFRIAKVTKLLWQTFKGTVINIVNKLSYNIEFDIHTLVHEMKEYLQTKAKDISRKIPDMIRTIQDELLNI